MVTLANFDTVLELGFGLNALFFLYELVPRTEERWRELVDKYEEAYKRKSEVTGSTEVIPIGFLVSATYPWKKRWMARITVAMSLLLLGTLIYRGFVPEATISSVKMAALLAFTFVIPCLAILVSEGPVRSLRLVIDDLERQTRKVRGHS